MLNLKNGFLIRFLLTIPFLTLISENVFAQSAGAFLYEGQLLDLNGQPIRTPVMIRTKIVSPNNSLCVLYDGSITVTPDVTGYVHFQVGSSAMTRSDAGTYPLEAIFINNNTFTSINCAIGNSYTPSLGDGRKMLVSVSDDTGTTWDDLGAVDIQAVPVANLAFSLNGLNETNFMRGANKAAMPALSSADIANFQALINGTSNLYARSSSSTGTLSESEIPVLSTAGKVSGSSINSGTIGGSTILSTSGTISTTGMISGSTISASTTLNTHSLQIINPSSSAITISSPASLSPYSLTLPNNTGTTGQVLTTDGSGILSWQTPSVGGGGSGTVTSITTGTGLTGGPITTTGTISLSSTGVVSGTYGNGSSVPSLTIDSQGRVTSATSSPLVLPQSLSTSSSPTFAALSLSGNLNLSAQTNTKLGSYSSAQETTLIATPLTTGDAGRTWYNTTTNQVRYWDGSAVQTVGSAGSGFSSLNGQTNPTQTFAIGGGGSNPGWISVSGIHTLNLPYASTGSVTGGLISNSDYVNFNSKLSNSLTNGKFYVGNASSIATAVSASGDVSLTNTGNFNVNLNGSTSKILGLNPGLNRLVMTDGSGGSTLIGLATGMNSILMSDGSLTPNWTVITADNFPQYPLLAGRASSQVLQGGANAGGTLTLDSTSNASKGSVLINPTGGLVGIGTSSPTANLHIESPTSTIYAKSSSTTGLSSIDLGNNNSQHLTMTLYGSAAGTTKYGVSTNGSAILESNVANNLIVGTASTTPLIFGTNNTERMRIDPSSGNVGIGTTTPKETLSLNSTNSLGTSLTVATPGTSSTQQVMINLMTLNSGNSTFGTGSTGKGWQIFANGNNYFGGSGGTPNDLGITNFDGTSWKQALTVKPAGDIGIGNLNPVGKVDIVVSSSTQPALKVTNQNTNGPALQVGSGSIKNMGLCSVTTTSTTANSWSGLLTCTSLAYDNTTVVYCSPPSGFSGLVSARASTNGYIQIITSVAIGSSTTFNCMWMN